MAADISNVTARQAPTTINETANLAKGMGLSEKATQTIKDVAALLGSEEFSYAQSELAESEEVSEEYADFVL